MKRLISTNNDPNGHIHMSIWQLLLKSNMKYLICMTLLMNILFMITACGNNQNGKNPNGQTENHMPLSVQPDIKVQMRESHILVTTEQGNEIIFALNNSSAAKSLYQQLPLTVSVENYGNNEKIFYPPEKLDTANVVLNSGVLKYYAPWGDVFMVYGTHNENEKEVSGDVNGVCTLGDVVSGEEYIESLAGQIKIEAIADETTEVHTDENGNIAEDNAAADALS